jgi:peptidyl-prolyl cis-trans isomerase C
MKPGTYSKEPVQTQFGWHVIKLEETRMAEPPAFEDIKPQLTAMVQRQKIGEQLIAMRDKAMVELNEDIVKVRPNEAAAGEAPKPEEAKTKAEKQ